MTLEARTCAAAKPGDSSRLAGTRERGIPVAAKEPPLCIRAREPGRGASGNGLSESESAAARLNIAGLPFSAALARALLVVRPAGLLSRIFL